MRNLNILILDPANRCRWMLPDLSEQQIHFNVVTEEDLGNKNSYEAPEQLLAKIRAVTAELKVDYVILGNNLGAGLIKAAAIVERMRHRTFVVWVDRTVGDSDPYAALGYYRFSTRREMKLRLTTALCIN